MAGTGARAGERPRPDRRQQAIEADAPKIQDKEFRDADENLINVTSNIEKNKLSDAIANRSALQLVYLEQ